VSKNLRNSNWYVQAKCVDENPRLFMSYDRDDIAKAKSICKDCEVKIPCVSTYGDVDCVAGGMTLYDRLVKSWNRIEDENEFNFD
jgi:hypothetical protein